MTRTREQRALVAATAAVTELSVDELMGKSKRRPVAYARFKGFLAGRTLGWSYPKIRDAFGLGDHTSIIHGCDKAVRLEFQPEAGRIAGIAKDMAAGRRRLVPKPVSSAEEEQEADLTRFIIARAKARLPAINKARAKRAASDPAVARIQWCKAKPISKAEYAPAWDRYPWIAEKRNAIIARMG